MLNSSHDFHSLYGAVVTRRTCIPLIAYKLSQAANAKIFSSILNGVGHLQFLHLHSGLTGNRAIDVHIHLFFFFEFWIEAILSVFWWPLMNVSSFFRWPGTQRARTTLPTQHLKTGNPENVNHTNHLENTNIPTSVASMNDWTAVHRRLSARSNTIGVLYTNHYDPDTLLVSESDHCTPMRLMHADARFMHVKHNLNLAKFRFIHMRGRE